MRKLLLSIFLLLPINSFATDGVSDVPVIFYTDLTSGPSSGGANNKGVFVSIYGRNFGSSQGSSAVTCGGGAVDNYTVWYDTWVNFQLGASAATGNIIITTPSGTSNGVPFTVRAGNIYFVDDDGANPGSGTYADPWQSPASYFTNMVAGDTCYIRAGTYNGTYHSYTSGYEKYQICIKTADPEGTANNEIAWVGYPGEVARFEANSGSLVDNIGLVNVRDYYVFANLQFYAKQSNIYFAGYNCRWIGNDCSGCIEKPGPSYADIYVTVSNSIKIYGNTLHGALSQNKLDHPIYIQGGSDNIDIGWNHFYDNDVQQGQWVSIHQDNSYDLGYKFENILIHDNLFEMSNVGRAVGIGSTYPGSTVNIYNNIVTGPTTSTTGYHLFFQYSASANWYNNTVYDVTVDTSTFCFYVALQGTHRYAPETINMKNNIIQIATGESGTYVQIDNEDEMTAVNILNNCYHGNGNGPERDTAAINDDPGFTDPANSNFLLLSTSPCIGTGYNVSDVVTADKNGLERPQGANFEIGAYEWFTGIVGGIKTFYGTLKGVW